MGKKGEKGTSDAAAVAARLLESIEGLGDVAQRKMFGGVGIFESGTMFAMVDSKGRVFFRGGDANRALFEEAGSEKHERMPYYSVPESILEDPDASRVWAGAAIDASGAAKKD